MLIIILLFQTSPVYSMTGWPKYFPNIIDPLKYHASAGISFADINGDNYLEVIANFRYDIGDTLYVYDFKGNILWQYRDSMIQYPAFGDLNNNGINEVIFGSAYGINVLTGNGEQMPNFPLKIADCEWSEVSIADVNGDDSLDIIFFIQLNKSDVTYLYAMNSHGKPLLGWPRVMPKFWFTHPAVADIDNDGKMEIVYNTWLDSLYCFNSDATIKAGFPVKNRLTTEAGVSEIILLDIDNDSFIEIVSGSSTPWADTGCLYIHRWDGSDQPGWPVYFSNAIIFHANQYHFAVGDIDKNNETKFIITSNSHPLRILDQSGYCPPSTCKWHDEKAINPVIANINDTPEREIITNSLNGLVCAFDHHGNMCNGWPMISFGTRVNYFNEITVDDIDNDGLIELGLIVIDGTYPLKASLHVWKLNGTPNEIEWGCSYYDLHRTCYFKR